MSSEQIIALCLCTGLLGAVVGSTLTVLFIGWWRKDEVAR